MKTGRLLGCVRRDKPLARDEALPGFRAGHSCPAGRQRQPLTWSGDPPGLRCSPCRTVSPQGLHALPHTCPPPTSESPTAGLPSAQTRNPRATLGPPSSSQPDTQPMEAANPRQLPSRHTSGMDAQDPHHVPAAAPACLQPCPHPGQASGVPALLKRPGPPTAFRTRAELPEAAHGALLTLNSQHPASHSPPGCLNATTSPWGPRASRPLPRSPPPSATSAPGLLPLGSPLCGLHLGSPHPYCTLPPHHSLGEALSALYHMLVSHPARPPRAEVKPALAPAPHTCKRGSRRHMLKERTNEQPGCRPTSHSGPQGPTSPLP